MSEPNTALVDSGDRWTLRGPLTMDTAADALAASAALPLPSSGVIDLAGVESIDSAAVAMLLAWRRRATVEGKPLSFANVPSSLYSLADLYSVRELISPEDQRRVSA